METLEIFDFQVLVDRETTRQWYAAAAPWGCTCHPCRRFLALAQARRLPAPVLRLLDHLAIPPEKATYVCALDANADTTLYQIVYRLAGRILRGDEQRAVLRPWGGVRCCHAAEPVPHLPEPHFDLEWSLRLPRTAATGTPREDSSDPGQNPIAPGD